jgi:hypothetical protein
MRLTWTALAALTAVAFAAMFVGWTIAHTLHNAAAFIGSMQ